MLHPFALEVALTKNVHVCAHTFIHTHKHKHTHLTPVRSLNFPKLLRYVFPSSNLLAWFQPTEFCLFHEIPSIKSTFLQQHVRSRSYKHRESSSENARSCPIVCWQCLRTSSHPPRRESWFVTFANFHDVNISTMANFKLPTYICQKWVVVHYYIVFHPIYIQ